MKDKKLDQYLSPGKNFQRLVQEYNIHKSLVIAFDFDGTVYDFHKTGETYELIIELLKDLKSIGCYIICFTANDDIRLITRYLLENKIPFDSINANPPFFTSNANKIYYNALLDDRAGLIQTYNELRKLADTHIH